MKRVARFGLESRLSAPVRSAIVAREATAEAAFVRQLARRARVHVFEADLFWKKLQVKPKSDTFFILGSGSSVNELSAHNFEEMGRNYAVGINNWGIHPFVPDIYSLDSVPWVGDGQNFRRSLDLLHRADIVAAQPQLLTVRLSNPVELQHLNTLPQELKRGVHFYGRVTPATREVRNLRGDLSRTIKMLQTEYSSVVVDSGASVVRMISIGLALGFRKIVLVGVDLKDTKYFWEDNAAYLSDVIINVPVNNQRNTVHETTSTWIRPFSVVDMVEAISEVVSNRWYGEVFAASSSSALSNFLPIYPWN